MSPKIIVVGSSNTDLVVRCDHLPKPGETLLGGKYMEFAGGKGANQAVAAARAGGAVTFIGACGEDDFGSKTRIRLQKEGINTRYFFTKKKINSGIASIFLGGRSNENVIVVASSANDLLSPADVKKAASSFKTASLVLAQLEIPLPAVRAAARLAKHHKIPFILNPAPARKLPSDLLRQVHSITPNEHEICLITGKKTMASAAEFLLSLGCQNIIVTLGAKGAACFTREGTFRIKAPKVKPKDTVGAGDCFTGWFSVGLANGLSLKDSARQAVLAASIAVTRPGAQSGMPFKKDLSKSKKKRSS